MGSYKLCTKKENNMITKINTLRWNIGLAVIRFGYYVRNCPNPGEQNLPTNFRWKIGVFVLWCGYRLRGGIPNKTWKWNHI